MQNAVWNHSKQQSHTAIKILRKNSTLQFFSISTNMNKCGSRISSLSQIKTRIKYWNAYRKFNAKMERTVNQTQKKLPWKDEEIILTLQNCID